MSPEEVSILAMLNPPEQKAIENMLRHDNESRHRFG